MIGLAITLILMVVFFFYIRQKLFMFENRLELMSETIETMALVTRTALQESDEESDESSETSECSDVHLDYESRERTPERVTVSDDDVKRVSLPAQEVCEEIEVKKMIEPDVKIVPEFVETVGPFDSLTLKELKDKVAELNGPKLKTKKELIEFLQNKI
jgi:type I site-specific restriction-modification system R (restriction) subunit